MAVSRKAMTEGIRTPTFLGTLNKAQFDNPSDKNQRFLPAVHCGMTATGSHGNFDSLRGAPPFAQGSRGAPAPVRLSMFLRRTIELCRIRFFDCLNCPAFRRGSSAYQKSTQNTLPLHKGAFGKRIPTPVCGLVRNDTVSFWLFPFR